MPTSPSRTSVVLRRTKGDAPGVGCQQFPGSRVYLETVPCLFQVGNDQERAPRGGGAESLNVRHIPTYIYTVLVALPDGRVQGVHDQKVGIDPLDSFTQFDQVAPSSTFENAV